MIYNSWTVQPNILMRLSSVPHECWGCIATFLGFLRIFNAKLCQWRDMAYHGGSHILRVCVVCMVYVEAGSDPRGHLGVTSGVYLCAGKPPLADIILSHPPDLTRCDSVIGLPIPAMSGHIQYRGAASGDLYIGISGINRVLLS